VKRIWAPWRKEYLTLKKDKSCIFCDGKKSRSQDKKRYIVARTKHSFAMLNKYPYNNGHVMIAPKRHIKGLEYLKENELLDLMNLVNQIKLRLDRALKPEGYNIGLNIGKIAGAGFPGHVHVHIVPRWSGDTNYMPVISNTKVVSYSLSDMYKLLKD